MRCIVDISFQVIEPVREMMAIGEEARHIEQHGITSSYLTKKPL
ncbi:MAG: hypothetical protein ACXVIU_11820 [Halobacteriota archaeon]